MRLKIYWRPRRVSRTVLLLISVLSLAGYACVEIFKINPKRPYYAEKMEAARLAKEAMAEIRNERSAMDLPIDTESDPAESGLIGTLMTPVTSDTGVLSAKQTSLNPNFAAIIVHWLKTAEVAQGDVVAIGASGSFPAMNVCVYAAVQTLGLKPIIISSASGSQWGANDPNFLWIDMERNLYEQRIFDFRSVAASVGGLEDRGLGMSQEGRDMLTAGIERNKLLLIKSKDFTESIDRRMAIYREKAGAAPIKAYINIGGGTTSVGTLVGKKLFQPGLNLREPPKLAGVDSVMTRFIRRHVPVIHLVQVEDIAKRYGLPLRPTTIPPVGEGNVFFRNEYNPWLTGAVLLGILFLLYAFVRSDWGFRIMQGTWRKPDAGHPEPMI